MDPAAQHLDLVTFTDAHPGGHLVAGLLPDEVSGAELSALRRHIRRLIESLNVRGTYATGLVRTAETTEIHCLFEKAEDAGQLAAWVNAQPARDGAGERRFVIDEAMRDALREAATGGGNRASRKKRA
ncbi:hypothetical protein [Reyranella sp.]|uniref:hypothetical protein n=1 Tax=Reyranella sp. TaxID=1929291 RepID=UPI003BA85B3F